MIKIRSFIALRFLVALFAGPSVCYSQSRDDQGVYVDAKGVLRWQKSNQEASFFGVNYTVPFAYGYRSHKALGIDPEKAIQQDVYHMARMGINAFRVHVWDTEISDSTGNLLQNEHLRLFDFLLAELKKRKIKILITPIAFWGNGYPERDEKTPGFSAKYGKEQSLVNEDAIKAQENYLKQFFTHVNPYTKSTYLNDPDIIAAEINNEPKHSGPKEAVKDYVNRMVAAVRSTGWKKPVFYNITESPWYGDAVANANIDGVSFQWYPSGLVANHTLKGNFLPHVDKYVIPFDTIPAFGNKAKMVYEFDAGDILQPVMYPAMARSFRTAGFQWATQFSYDPMATAYANTEYQTHYLNLAYTPAKAISLMIANKVFHQVPRLKDYGEYPATASFETFRISYKESLSEMNSPEAFYYTTNTVTKPVAISKLKSVAGVGSSSVINYEGTGTYFLDKLEKGIWRLEVMPDAILIGDPFAKASPQKEVVRIEWRSHPMSIHLADLGEGFEIRGINEGNSRSGMAQGRNFSIYPGSYLLVKKGKSIKDVDLLKMTNGIKLREFVAPQASQKDVFVYHQPVEELTPGKAFRVEATVAGLKPGAKVILLINQLAGKYKTFAMNDSGAYRYSVEVPADLVVPGRLHYRILVQDGDDYTVFPGNRKGSPWTWDYYFDDSWTTHVASSSSGLELYNAAEDHRIRAIPNWNPSVRTGYTSAGSKKGLLWQMHTEELPAIPVLGFQTFIGDKLSGRISEADDFKSLVVKARSTGQSTEKLKISLIDSQGQAFSAWVTITKDLHERTISLTSFQADSAMLLPRPYPDFRPLWFKPSKTAALDLSEIEKFELSLGSELPAGYVKRATGFEIEWVRLGK